MIYLYIALAAILDILSIIEGAKKQNEYARPKKEIIVYICIITVICIFSVIYIIYGEKIELVQTIFNLLNIKEA